MFTGLIEDVGAIAGVMATPAGLRVRVSTGLWGDIRVGESVAVNGICLTVAGSDEGAFDCDVGPETIRATTVGSWAAGQPVNLERALPADGRIGGHFVLGHADGTGRVEELRIDGDARWLRVALAPGLAPFVVPKGSIALDGISLTVAVLERGSFDVMIVPFTWDHTNLRSVVAGHLVNLECDILGKYVVRGMELAARP